MNSISPPARDGRAAPFLGSSGAGGAHPGWRRARGAALEALRAGGAVLLTGEAGSGKTLLLRELERALRAEGQAAQLHENAAMAGPATTPGEVRLLDEADALDDAALRRAAEGGAVVLAGLPGLAARVEALGLPSATVSLPALVPEDMPGFVSAWLGAAGEPPDLFGDTALAMLFLRARGLPRLVTVLAQGAVLMSRMDGATRVGPHHVEAADAMRAGIPPATRIPEATTPDAPPLPVADAALAASPQPTSRSGRRWAALLLLLPLLGAAGWWLLDRRQPPPAREAPAASPAPAREASPTAPAIAAPAIAAREIEAAPAARPGPAAGPAPPSRAAVPAPLPASPPGAAPAQPPSAPAPPRRAAAPAVDEFRGSAFNETIGQGGRLRLVVRPAGPNGAVTVRFEASAGLVGAGEMTGRIAPDGTLTASGVLMMGRNPFATELQGRIVGDTLAGTARYERVAAPGIRAGVTRGSFRLQRS